MWHGHRPRCTGHLCCDQHGEGIDHTVGVEMIVAVVAVKVITFRTIALLPNEYDGGTVDISGVSGGIEFSEVFNKHAS